MFAYYEVCADCGQHGRVVGSRGGRYGEQMSKVLARVTVWIAAEQGLIATGVEVQSILRQIDASTMPEDQDDIQPHIRNLVADWNREQLPRWPKQDPAFIHAASRQLQ